MAFSASVRRVLISCPGDVPRSDLTVIHHAINRWNGVYGERFASVVLPISWGTHAAAQFGGTPQDLLNRQLVDRCDFCIAIFANRLGTPTSNAESGTAEEIERLGEAGKYVAVLRSNREVSRSNIDLQQAVKLDEYLKRLTSKALILEYEDDLTLGNQVETILVAAVQSEITRTRMELPEPTSAALIIPRVVSEDRVRTDSKGRVRTSRNWYLVLENTGEVPAENVSVKFESSEPDSPPWDIHRSNSSTGADVEIIAPGASIRLILFAALGMASQVKCTVTWSDGRGDGQSNVTTLRLA
ncbi:hypothetical protein [Cryptosporangium aurantiacum]|uniref:hypothetical protein n=1 Tax=Cryptosporangium aurantiacum TaxID=134849 RepID=UPI0011611A07|nr:hypothetical protein [Cryptosporangium aurantiacum]